MDNARLINQASGKTEYYTDPVIVNAAWEVMGAIDLDPASTKKVQEGFTAARLPIRKIYTVEDNGLVMPWVRIDGKPSRVWLNHPFSRGQNKLWIDKLMAEVKCGNVEQACCITYAATSEHWLQPLLSYPVCFLSPRTNYYLPDGTLAKGVTKGSMVTYIGKRVATFAYCFGRLGKVMIPLGSE